jgi:hypothetical protein
MDYYFIQKHADLQRSFCCPFLRCRIPCTSAVELVEHIKTCPKFYQSEMWCPDCDVAGTYHANKSSCAWKKHGFAERVLRPIKSIPLRRQPSAVLSQLNAPQPCASQSNVPRLDAQRLTSTYILEEDTEVDAAEIDSRIQIPELSGNPVRGGYPVEIDSLEATMGLYIEAAPVPVVAAAEYVLEQPAPQINQDFPVRTIVELPVGPQGLLMSSSSQSATLCLRPERVDFVSSPFDSLPYDFLALVPDIPISRENQIPDHGNEATRSSDPRSLPIEPKMIRSEFHDCLYTYKEPETHNYSKHRSRAHKKDKIFRCDYPGCRRSYKNRKDNLKKYQRLSHHIASLGHNKLLRAT